MELSLQELKNMKSQVDCKLKELELKNKELELKNRGLELQLATAKQKYKTEQLIMNCDVNKKHFELKTMEMKFRHEMERIKEEKEAEEARREEEERKEYEARCAKYEHLMTSTKELIEQIDYKKNNGTIRRKIMSIYKTNILAMLNKDFPGVKFSLTSKSGTVSVEWTDGPTKKEVQEKCDLSLFYKYVYQSDPYSDYGYYRVNKHSDFAQKYGSYAYGYDEEIRLYRGTSEECFNCALGFISDIVGREVQKYDKMSNEERDMILMAANKIDPNLPGSPCECSNLSWATNFGNLAEIFIYHTSF